MPQGQASGHIVRNAKLGDLEAVQDCAAWRQREVLAMRVLYRLNWIRYEHAMRYESSTAVRKRLLDHCQIEFVDLLKQFNVVQRIAAVAVDVESVIGMRFADRFQHGDIPARTKLQFDSGEPVIDRLSDTGK